MTIVILVDFLIVAALLVADLVSKHYVAAALAPNGSYEAIKDVLTFRYSENRGAAFGIFTDSRTFLCVFVGIVILGLIGYMVYSIVKKKYKEKGGMFLHVALSMILAGGIGNLVDRIAFGYVRDFIEYTFIYTLFKRDFAICNLADVFLTVGVIMVVIYLILLMVDESKKGKALVAEAQSQKGDTAGSPGSTATPDAKPDNSSDEAAAREAEEEDD